MESNEKMRFTDLLRYFLGPVCRMRSCVVRPETQQRCSKTNFECQTFGELTLQVGSASSRSCIICSRHVDWKNRCVHIFM